MSTVNVRVKPGGWAAALRGLPLAGRAQRAGLWPGLAEAGLLVGDLAVVLGAFLLAYWVRFIAPDAEAQALGLEHYVRLGTLVGLATVGLLGLHGYYDVERAWRWSARLSGVVSAVSTALVLVVVVTFFVGEPRFSRLWFATGWALAVGGLLVWRALAERFCRALRAALAPAPRALVVGANPLGQELARELAPHYHVVGYVDNGSDLVDEADRPLLGSIADLEALVQAQAIDELIVALPSHRREQLSRVIARGFRRSVQVRFLPELGDALPRRLEVQLLGGRPYLRYAPVARVTVAKRLLDLAVAGASLVVLWPLLAAIALAIKLDSRGPVFYRHQRVGKDGKLFWMYKFRSMRSDADSLLAALRAQNEATGPLFKMRRDPRITRVGRCLRRWSLDELPQLINVVRGEMSLVGPRPPLPAEVAQYEDWEHGRLRAVPGLTGLWQVSGRSEVPFHDMVRLDLHYIGHWSLALDLEILLRTVPAVLTSRGAY